MPQNVRNFWIEGNIDGRGPVSFGGPQARDGGFSLTIMQRNEGHVAVALRIRGVALNDGRLVLDVAWADHEPDKLDGGIQIRTER